MDKKINLAILAVSKIAGTVTETLIQLPYLNVYAVASRNKEKAEQFATKFNIEHSFGSYEEMLQDSSIDLVYITTPHSLHLQYIKMCADYGKNIICEKAFTLNEKQANEAFEYCKKKNVLIAEAIWSRYTPMGDKLREVIDSGVLGTIHSVYTSLGYQVWHRERLHNINLGGGALLDVGIYCLNFLDIVTSGNNVIDVQVNAKIDKDYMVDRNETVSLTYSNGIKAQIYNSIDGITDRTGYIYGDNGYIVVQNINNFESIKFYRDNRSTKTDIDILAPEMISGYEYEFKEVCDAINNGKKEVLHASYKQTLRLMNIMDKIRKEMNVIYPNE